MKIDRIITSVVQTEQENDYAHEQMASFWVHKIGEYLWSYQEALDIFDEGEIKKNKVLKLESVNLTANTNWKWNMFCKNSLYYLTCLLKEDLWISVDEGHICIGQKPCKYYQKGKNLKKYMSLNKFAEKIKGAKIHSSEQKLIKNIAKDINDTY